MLYSPIIANKEENVKEQIEELEKHFPVWISDVNKLTDAYEMIEQIGIISNKESKAKMLISHIKTFPTSTFKLKSPNYLSYLAKAIYDRWW